MSEAVTRLIDDGVDIYEFLELTEDASEAAIRKQYRKAALKYHPDKNPTEGARAKFALLATVYEILTSEKLRKHYDDLRASLRSGSGHSTELSKQTQIFKDALRKAEAQHRFDLRNVYDSSAREYVSKRKSGYDLELLREEGLKLRRLNETKLLSQTKVLAPNRTILFDELPISNKVAVSDSRHVLVKWKRKREVDALFTADVLQEIMGIFGPIKRAVILTGKGDRYQSGIVEYESDSCAHKAANHDYRQSARLWDGTNVRKLASLLRECTIDGGTPPDLKIDLVNALGRSTRHDGTGFKPSGRYCEYAPTGIAHLDRAVEKLIKKQLERDAKGEGLKPGV